MLELFTSMLGRKTALAGLLWTLEPNAAGVNFHSPAYAPQPNWRFNADANTGHAFGIFMASVGALRLRLRRRLT